jgi:hypothetical protein
LVAAARSASDPRDADITAPYAFATRVTTLAFSPRHAVNSLLERFAWRAVFVACALTILSTAASYSLLSGTSSEDDSLTDDGTVSALLDLSS